MFNWLDIRIKARIFQNFDGRKTVNQSKQLAKSPFQEATNLHVMVELKVDVGPCLDDAPPSISEAGLSFAVLNFAIMYSGVGGEFHC